MHSYAFLSCVLGEDVRGDGFCSMLDELDVRDGFCWMFGGRAVLGEDFCSMFGTWVAMGSAFCWMFFTVT